ncbi:MAG: ABC transporter ATP-binding protein [Spirochaetaceae bacterium]|nr:MAG: ABC transporter ATP-binding protein [Spirochaetaceae bacterium]
MKSEYALELKNVTKTYGETVAVDKLSFVVPHGMIFGLLGPNGAGKTTTLECIEGLRKPDGGEIRVIGIDPVAHPRRLWDSIGVQLQTSGLPETMTAKEAIRFFSRYHGHAPEYGLLDRFGLTKKADDQFVNLSVGQKRRLALALAVAHDPQIVFLDEPTAGLDVESRMELHAMMAELKDAGKTIVLATHDMAEAEKLCDEIAIVIAGKLGVVGTPSRITAAGDKRTRITVSSANGTFTNGAPELPEATVISTKDGYAQYSSENPSRSVTALLALLEKRNDEIVDLRVERPTLEERFIEITGRTQK